MEVKKILLLFDVEVQSNVFVRVGFIFEMEEGCKEFLLKVEV